MVDYQRLITALKRPSAELGCRPELAALRPDFEIFLYETLPSTNRTAWQLVDRGHGAGTVVIAREQTAGRGQWGRTWESSRGGLYLSLVLEPELPLDRCHLLTLTSAWGIVTSLNTLGIALQIKWPNDLINHGHKVGGILTESRLTTSAIAPQGTQLQQVVIGLGMNWANPLTANAISLKQLLPDVPHLSLKTLEDLAAIALRGILQGFYYWQQQGDAAFVAAYQQKLAHRGKKVSVDGHPALVEGVSSTGELVVIVERNGQKFARSLKPGEISLGYNG